MAGIKSARFVLGDNNDQVDVQVQYDLLLVGGREGRGGRLENVASD